MEIVIRAAAMYAVLLCLLRAMGRRELSQMTTFDLLITVVIGDLIGQGVIQEDMSFTGALLAVGTCAPRRRQLLRRLPSRAELVASSTVLPSGDRPQWRSLRGRCDVNSVTEDQLMEAARSEQVADLTKIRTWW